MSKTWKWFEAPNELNGSGDVRSKPVVVAASAAPPLFLAGLRGFPASSSAELISPACFSEQLSSINIAKEAQVSSVDDKDKRARLKTECI